jgi:hypothetical protein
VLSMGKNGGTHMAIGEGGGLGKQNAGVLMGFWVKFWDLRNKRGGFRWKTLWFDTKKRPIQE